MRSLAWGSRLWYTKTMGKEWTMSDEARAKISAAAKKRYEGYTVMVKCKQCPNEYKVSKTRLADGRGKFCSKVCKIDASKGVRVAKGTEFKKGQKPWNAGVPMSEERKKSQSEAFKGRTLNTGRTHFKKGNVPWIAGKHIQTNDALKIWRENGGVSHNYKGDEVGYYALHAWVARHRGKPKECEFCGTTDESKRFEWANIDGKYRRSLDDFIKLCKKCHNNYDGVNAWQQKKK